MEMYLYVGYIDRVGVWGGGETAEKVAVGEREREREGL